MNGSEPRESTVEAVIFDLGGVVLGSPLHAIAAYEADHGLTAGLINRHVAAAGPDGAWQRLERGELTVGEGFFDDFDRELAGAGHAISSRVLMARIAEISKPRKVMLVAIDRLRAAGFRVAALTNNWREDGEADNGSMRHPELDGRFHEVIESRRVGLRKPDPEIYRLACRTLQVAPERAAFLDDIGANLKSARVLGMRTIKVDDPAQALRELEALVGIDLI